MSDAAGSHRYHFNCTGLVKEIAYPNKAIIQFKLNAKDKCNYYAMRAWKNSPEFDNKSAGGGPPTTNGAHAAHPANTKYGTGWISELNPRKGVLTFDNNGCDERVLFLASKVYFFEKRLGAKQSLNGKIYVFERFSFNVLIWPNKLQ